MTRCLLNHLPALAMSLVLIAGAAAHPARTVAAVARIEADGTYELLIRFDLPAYLLNETPARADDDAMHALLDEPSAALQRELLDGQERMRATLAVHGDGVETSPASVHWPSLAEVEAAARLEPRLPLMADAILRGRLSPGTRTVRVRFPEALGDVILTVEQPHQEAFAEPVRAGELSSPLPLRPTPEPATEPTAAAAAASIPTAATSPSGFATSLQFLHWGFTHILPHGLDHVLFVLGLFLLNHRLAPLLWQVTAFTLAHTVTLVLSMFGWIDLPEHVVEPLIAASIAFVAIENLFTRDLKPWRPVMVFAFGLLHGLGFAGVLREAHLPPGQFLNAVLSFNVGVELGQLTVIALALLAVGWCRSQPWYRPAISIPASAGIASIALFWTIQRLGLL